MDAKIIFYKQTKLDQNTKFKLRRELLGIEQKSNFARYKYKIEGILNKIPHYRPIDSTIIVQKKDADKIIKTISKYGAEYELFGINIDKAKLVVK